MQLKTQIILVAVLFVVFAALSMLATARGAPRSRRLVRRRAPGTSDDSAVPPLARAAREDLATGTRRGPAPLLIAIAILGAVVAAVSVLWFSDPR